MSAFRVLPQAVRDLALIWHFIAKDKAGAAERVQAEFFETFALLALMPEQGYQRRDLTKRSVRFFPLYSYLIIYDPSDPVRILGIIHGNRNLKRLLKERLF
jgi:toxin ParE1/3/4